MFFKLSEDEFLLTFRVDGCKDSRPAEWHCHSRSLNGTLSMRTQWRTLSFDNQKKTEHWVPSGTLEPSITFELQSKSGCLVGYMPG